MHLKRLLVIVCLLAALPASAATGVALVHGTGHQTNAASDYWTWDFVNTVRSGLPNSSNYTVINCDFEQYMWKSEAAGTPFAEGTAAFRIDPALGAGLFTLRSTGTVADPAARYAIHVFEKDSVVTLGVGNTANWMPQGVGSLDLHFDAAMLEDSGLGAPYELRDLQLLDQGRMGQLHRQALALVLE